MRAAGLTVVIGMALALATEEPPLILAGFLVVGLALAGVVPVVFSLAGDAAPGRSGGASSVITTIGYAGFLVGPGLIGAVAELTSLRLALATIVVTGLSISLLAGVAGGRR
jgi:MFS family permease